MIRTWVADVTPLYREDIYAKFYRAVPLHRQEKADRIRRREDRALSVGAWALYETALRECRATEEAVFNLSHSGELALCSIEDSGNFGVKVGCDLEKIKQFHENLVRRYFFSSEAAYIFGQKTDEERTEAFYRYWVLKESFMKATRCGMKLGLNTFEILCKGEEQPELVRQPDEIKERYFFKEYKLDRPYRVAVCSTEHAFAGAIKEIDLDTYWR